MRIAAKNNLFFIIILLFLILPTQFLMLKMPIFPSQDGLFHVERILQFDQSVRQGIIPPRLAPSLYNGIGYPLFVVNYQLPYYVAELFMLIFNNPFIAFKTVMSISYILSIVFAFFLFKNRGGNFASLCGALVFAYLPYRFANLYSRGALGESVAMAFVPCILLSLNYVNKKYGVLLLAIAVFGLITSHTVIFMLFMPFFITYCLFFVKLNKSNFSKIVLGLSFGLILSSFQLLPAIFEKKYLKFDQNLSGLFTGHFFSFAQIARIPLEGVNIGTPFQIGLTAIVVFLLSLASLVRKRSKEVIFFLAAIIVSLFLTQKQSLWLWQNLPFINYILYPWRFLSIILVAVSFLAVHLVEGFRFGKLLGIFLIIFVIFTSRHYFLKPTQFISNVPTPSTTTANEYDTIWTNQFTFERRPLVSSAAEVQIANVFENASKVTFNADSQNSSFITVRKVYFPGWHVLINNSYHKVKQKDGLVSFEIPKGKSNVELIFRETAIGYLSNFLSAFSLIGFTFILLYLTLKEKFVENWKHFT